MDSGSEHGDREDVPGVDQQIGNGELSTPPCSPYRKELPACPISIQGNPGSPRPEGGRTGGLRPNRLKGMPWATRWLKTVWGLPPGKTHHCSVFRNGMRQLSGNAVARLRQDATRDGQPMRTSTEGA